MPRRLGLFNRTVWTVHVTAPWAIRVTPWLSFAGRHSLVWYDAQNVRLRLHNHQVESAFHPLVASGHRRLHDRLAIGIETHTVVQSRVGDVDFKLGGIRDVVLYAGYGVDHQLGRRWSLGWHGQLRQVWVFVNTQRQARFGLRTTFMPAVAHRIALDAQVYVVTRDPHQAGNKLSRLNTYVQAAVDYGWMSRRNVGPWLRLRYTSGFMSGEVPVYEIREESLRAHYAEFVVGVHGTWD